jgi:hypothetical protein
VAKCGDARSKASGIRDGAILGAVAEVLEERVLDRAVDKALARLRSPCPA